MPATTDPLAFQVDTEDFLQMIAARLDRLAQLVAPAA